MPRWLLQLDGDRFHVDEFPRWFPSGPFHAITENGKVYVTGSTLDHLTNSDDVYQRISVEFEKLFSAIAVFVPGLVMPVANVLWHECDGSERKGYGFISVTMRGSSKFSASFSESGQETQAQQLYNAARKDPDIEATIEIWSSSPRTWARLYCVWESALRYAKRNNFANSLSSKAERIRFTHAANCAEVAGKDSRHARGECKPPSRPMKHRVAELFVAGVLQQVVRHAISAVQHPGAG